MQGQKWMDGCLQDIALYTFVSNNTRDTIYILQTLA